MHFDKRPYKKRRGHTTVNREEGHVMTEAEIGVIQLQAKDHRLLPEAKREAWTDSPSEVCQPYAHHGDRLLASKAMREFTFLLLYATQAVVLG